jgi:2-polyprenyl-6-methoxyphenol hydroxylase-like FAD-dependent oxidoreductase
MSPVGGVGINLAVQDAVAAANILTLPLRHGTLKLGDLNAVQDRRERPTQVTQQAQVFLHENLLEKIFDSPEAIPPPLVMHLTEKFPRLRGITARMVGMGFRPEHIRS